MTIPAAKQLNLSKEDRKALALEIAEYWTQGSSDLERRNNANRRWYQEWRAYTATENFNEQEKSNFQIPLIQWQVLAKLAKELDALQGEDAEIVVRPIGPNDAPLAPKVSRYMNWRIKQSLKLFKKLYDYLLQKIVLGTSIAYIGWKRKTRTVRRMVDKPIIEQQPGLDPMTGLPILTPQQVGTQQVEEEIEVVDFEGPDFVVENIEDWVIPPNTVDLETAERFARRLRLTVDEILDMSDDGTFGPISKDDVERLRRLAETGSPELPVDTGNEVVEEKRVQAGLPKESSQQQKQDKLVVVNYNGMWRSPKAKPEERAQDIVAYYQPDTQLLLGVSRLVDKFPDGRRPFVKSELIRDLAGTFWGIGLPELLESINREMDVQHNALTDASVYALGPVIAYEPAAGFNPQSFRYEPFTTLPVADANKVKPINIANINLGPYIALQSSLLGYAERISGLTEAELGRPFSQPNAPRTLGQQQIIAQGSGVRLLMDLRLERESLREMLKRIWELDTRFAPKPLFFRVSESAELEQMTGEEMQGNYDFDIGPLTSTANKYQDQQLLLQAYALNLQNPIAAQNPAILAEFLKKINTKFGQDEINKWIPDLSQMRPPQNPEQENALMPQGQDVDPHPQDNHVRHIQVHSDFAARVEQPLYPGVAELKHDTLAFRRPGLLGLIQSHIAEHERALQTGAVNIQGMGGMQGGQGGGTPTDTTQQPNDPMNSLKSLLNSGGQNLA